MSNLIRFEPMREVMSLRDAMDQLFNDSFTRPFSMSGGSAMPAVDLYQDPDNIFVKAILPGIKPADVQITVTEDILTIKGDYTDSAEQKDVTYIIREQRGGSFERTIRLPSVVQTDKARADFENGVLTITMPKSEAVKPRTITIQAK